MGTLMKTEGAGGGGGGAQVVPAKFQKTIQSIKEIVGNHSDFEIYNALKDSNMDPNETAQKLLNQAPFHEVKRRRDKKKENTGYSGHVEPKKRTENAGQGMKFHGSDRNVNRGGFRRSSVSDAGISKEFRVVRDNRVNQNPDREAKSSSHVSSLSNVQRISERSSSILPNYQRHSGGRYPQNPNGARDFRSRLPRDINSDSRNGHFEKKSAVTSSESQVATVKPNDSHSQVASAASSNVVGVYASASDPVHVPSPDTRSSAAIGAIRREVGVVGSRRQSSDSSSKQSLLQNNSNINPAGGSSSTAEPFRQINAVSRDDQTHATAVEPVVVSSTGNRSSAHFNNRSHQQSVGHQKGAVTVKEWKPKTTQKSSVSNPGVIGSPVKSISHLADSKNVVSEAEQVQDKLQQVNVQESQNVIIAQHIRVPENDRCRLTFGTFGMDSDSAENPVSTFIAVDNIEEQVEQSPSNQQMNPVDDQSRNSGCSSPSGASSENHSPDKRDSPGISNTQDFNDMGLVHNSSSLTASTSQQHPESAELPNFSAYDQQPAYDMSYFRPSIDDAVRGPGIPSPQEALSSHTANSVPSSSVGMLQQQAPMAQMYPQVHVSHYANVMPYRQFIPPIYVPPMVPGYSGNPGYPHLSNGNSYVFMPGGSSHLPANSLKYGVQQFKPFPAGSPTGYGNMANPNGYAINAPGVVGGPTGLDDSSRIKYKDNNLYVPNPQAETSEVWIQNHRDISGMQSTPYFNMPGQTAHPAAAYLQSHAGHASFNGAGVAQSSQMQFPGMYPPQPTGIPNAHHLGGGNIGVGVGPAAPGPQVGAYQQPQMSHLNWTSNF